MRLGFELHTTHECDSTIIPNRLMHPKELDIKNIVPY